MKNLLLFLFIVIFSAGAANAQTTINPNQGAGDDVSDVFIDGHTETVTENSTENIDDHSSSSVTETDNSTNTGDIITEVHGGQTDKHASRAPASFSGSAPDQGPCGDHTGMSVQTGIAGGGLATVSEACRAYRVAELERLPTVPRRFKVATEVAYWLGFPARLALAIVSGGALN